MMDVSPPRRAELLLDALGAKTEFRDSLIGDLAEEFALRAERDGPGAARRWYYREAVRVTPHLVRDWSRGQRPANVAHLASVVALSYVCVLIVSLFITLTVWSVIRATGDHPRMLTQFQNVPVSAAIAVPWLLVSSVGPLLGGYIAAWLDRRAPLVSALALGAFWACMVLAGNTIISTTSAPLVFPSWYRVAAMVVVAAGTTMGGILKVCTPRSLNAPVSTE